MKCELCDQKATVFYSQLIDGQMKKVCLCESCAGEKGVTDPDAFSMVDLIKDDAPQHAAVEMVAAGVGSCPHCGFTLVDFKKVGRLGCSECYGSFRDEIGGMLDSMHRGTTHEGKVPEGLVDVMERRQRLDKLKGELGEAISSEDYEKAAGLRDEIREVEELISQVGSE